MTAVWNGPTPYDDERARTEGDIYHRLFLGGQVDGYRAAMNSFEIQAMYDALTGRSWTPEQQRRTNAAIRAYKAGLKEALCLNK